MPGSPSAALTTTVVGSVSDAKSATVRHFVPVGKPAPPRPRRPDRRDDVDEVGAARPSSARSAPPPPPAARYVVELRERRCREHPVLQLDRGGMSRHGTTSRWVVVWLPAGQRLSGPIDTGGPSRSISARRPVASPSPGDVERSGRSTEAQPLDEVATVGERGGDPCRERIASAAVVLGG